MNYYISDLHLFCQSQTKSGINYDNRPFETVEELNNHILQRWNNKVTNGDTVYILGDVYMRGKNEDVISLVSRLKGKKVLIKGNHDDLGDYRYKQLFEEICDYKELTDCFGGKAYKLVLSHYPILMWNGQHKGTILLYGHTHNSVEEAYFQNCLHGMRDSEELSLRRHGGMEIKAYNVGCMMHYPMMEWPKSWHGSIHLHGHQHNKPEYNQEQKALGKLRYDVGVDANYYCPVSLNEILKFCKE